MDSETALVSRAIAIVIREFEPEALPEDFTANLATVDGKTTIQLGRYFKPRLLSEVPPIMGLPPDPHFYAVTVNGGMFTIDALRPQ